MASRTSRVASALQRGLDSLLGILLAVIALSLIYQVFGRYALNRAPGWTEELARLLIVWVAMLGSAACLRTGNHIAISALLIAVPVGVQRVLLFVRDAAVLFCAGLLAWSGFGYAVLNHSQESAALELPMSIPYAAIGIGGVLTAIMLLLMRASGEAPIVDATDW